MKLSYDFYQMLKEDGEGYVSVVPYPDSEKEDHVLGAVGEHPLFVVYDLLELLKEYEDDEDHSDEAELLKSSVLTSNPEMKCISLPEAKFVVIFKNIAVQVKEDAKDEIAE